MMPTLRQMIAQMLCIGFKGNDFNDAPSLRNWLKHSDGLGCLIHFDYDFEKNAYGKNIISLEQLQKLNQDIKTYYMEHHAKSLPIWLSIDLEGGKVDRLARAQGYIPIASAEEIAIYNKAQREQIWSKTATLLEELHFDINFAPVVDLNLSPNQGIFGPLKRCFSAQPETVIKLADECLRIFEKHHVHGCLKHFPGHGSASGDSHEGFVDVSDTFSLSELNPYRDLIANHSPISMIMTAHVINRQLDKSGRPATLSHPILTDLLRKEFGYQGIIISDDLQMHAISKYFSREEALIETIQAGADMIIFGNQLGWDEPQLIIDMIEKLVQTEKIDSNKIEQAYQRIQKFKKQQ
jgi:beta-N-acetylhexosaminidase